MKFTDLFSGHIDPLQIEVTQKRFIQTALVLGSLSMFTTAALAPNQRKFNLGAELFLGSMLACSSAFVSKKREEVENRYKAFLDLNKDHYKSQIKNEFSFRMTEAEIEGELNLAKTVRTLPLSAQIRYRDKFQLEGLVALQDKLNASEQAIADTQTVAGKRHNVATADVEMTETYIDKNSKSLLKSLASQYPELLKLDSKWITDLVASSTHKDLSKRINHSLYFCGETQSGKTTLASVFISLIASMSQNPAIVAIHDAKQDIDGVDVNNWLCDFSYKLPGFESTKDWLKLTTDLIKQQKQKAGTMGLPFDGLAELIIAQDEVDTAYGKGKGYGELVDSTLAQKLQSSWLSWIKTLAGFKGHAIFMGQSPLAEDTGINKPSMSNLCFICINNTTDYILKNSGMFLKHVTDEEVTLLKEFCALFEQMRTSDPEGGLRYALVRPMAGKPYVALIPNFKKNTDETEELSDESTRYADDQGINDTSNTDNDTNSNVNDTDDTGTTPVTDTQSSDEPTPSTSSKRDLYDLLTDWVVKMEVEKQLIITDADIKKAWMKIANQELTNDAVKVLREIINKKAKRLQ